MISRFVPIMYVYQGVKILLSRNILRKYQINCLQRDNYLAHTAEAHLEPRQTCKMETFTEMETFAAFSR